jgi:hypothetical protein
MVGVKEAIEVFSVPQHTHCESCIERREHPGEEGEREPVRFAPLQARDRGS